MNYLKNAYICYKRSIKKTMTTITVNVPKGKESEVSSYVKKIGGTVVTKTPEAEKEVSEDDEVTHGVFFGENIQRVIKAFKKQ